MTPKHEAKIFNERVKLLAGMLDRVGLAAIVVGLFQPLAMQGGIGWASLFWLLGGAVLYAGGHFVLGFIREE